MALSPLDIKNKSFSTKMRGYNPDEVDEFLNQVTDDYEDALRSKRELEKGLKHAEEKLTYFNELKDALNQSIIVAQDTADKLKDSASRESDLLVTSANADAKSILSQAQTESDTMISEATRKANEIMSSATANASQLAHETDDLKKKTREFHRNLALLLESQLEIVKSKDWEEMLRPFSSYVEEDHSAIKELLAKEQERQTTVQVEVEPEAEGSIEAIDLQGAEKSSADIREELDSLRKSINVDVTPERGERKERKSRRDP